MVKHDENSVADLTSEQRVGKTIQALRIRSGLSLRTLAMRAGFSASFISQVEHGLASPSIASLEKIATALGVTLSEFFSQNRIAAESLLIIRATERQKITSDWSNATLEALGPATSTSGVTPLMLTLMAGGKTGSQSVAHPGQEFAFVFKGEVQLTLEDVKWRLAVGDSISFSSETPHHWENPGPEPAQILMVSTGLP